MDIDFLAVIEVPKSQRVRCQAEGCGHSVYKRVHIIRVNNELGVYGSECAKKFFGTYIKDQNPYYTSSSGSQLSESDVNLLKENTEKLLIKLQDEYNSSIKPVAQEYIKGDSQINIVESTSKNTRKHQEYKSFASMTSEEHRKHLIEQLKALAAKGNDRAKKDLEVLLRDEKYKF